MELFLDIADATGSVSTPNLIIVKYWKLALLVFAATGIIIWNRYSRKAK